MKPPSDKISTSSTLELIEKVYSAIDAPHVWDSVINDLSEFFKSPCSGFFLQNQDGRLLDTRLTGISSEKLGEHDSYYGGINPWFATPGLMREGKLLTEKSLNVHHDDKKYFTETEYYNDWFSPQGYHHALGGQLHLEGNSSLNVTLLRSRSEGEYTEYETQSFQKVFGHLSKSLKISNKLVSITSFEEKVLSVTDQLGIGIALIDEEGEVLNQSIALNMLLDKHKSIFNLKSSKIVFSKSKLQRYFLRSLRNVLSTSNSHSWNLRVNELCTLHFQLQPDYSSKITPFQSAKYCSITISDTTRKLKIFAKQIVRELDLTGREAEICSYLANGYSLRQCANFLSISYETTRWHLKQIFLKTNTSSQEELAHLLFRSTP